MALWLDKHRPKTLAQTDYNKELSTRLCILADSVNLPHLLVYGPNGSGKKTRVIGILREIFGPGVDKIKVDSRVFQTSSGKKIDFTMVSSIYHIEITPSDVGRQDGAIIQHLLKEIAQTQQIDQRAKRKFKLVVINEADKLSIEAQSALRRTMEKFSSNIRLIMLATSTSSIISPIRSRTLLIRVPAPSNEEISNICLTVANRESVQVASQVCDKIAIESNGNLRIALLMLESMYIQHGSLLDVDSPLVIPDWILVCREIANSIIKKRDSSTILFARSKLYDLLAHCIPPTEIIKTLLMELIKLSGGGDELQTKLIHSAIHFQHRLAIGSKDIFHLEAFIVKFMYLYESSKN